ncbi:MAG: aminopeptidase, partial [Firmicutes bacterium]|nr:aminopeptidase [Bacillota bacterium]
METKLQEYARLLVEVGLNVQKGQTVLIRTPVQCVDFVRLCAKAAYDAGCREVLVDFTDDALGRMKYLRADPAVFDECPAWLVDKMTSLAEGGMGFLGIAASDPEMLKGVDPDRILRSAQAMGKGLKPYYAMQMSNAFPWCLVSAPTLPWAKKVFPHLADDDAIASLWDAIFTAVRVTGDGKAVARWREHIAAIHARCEHLDALAFASLHYQNSLGTDLTVELPENHLWLGGAEVTKAGRSFAANMPTEEIFTAPRRDGVNGRVVSSMPFVLNGNVIERFAFTLEHGKIVRVEADNARDKTLLEDAISVDEGAAYLGEVALVPYDSPIRSLGILFYNTLFDENASC